MKHTILTALLAIVTTALLAGCASSPRELANHKLIPGGEYTGKADNNRPDEIKYQPLPDHVQYVRASDSLVIAAFNELKEALAAEEDNLKIAQYLFLMPGTWENFKDDEELQKKFKKQKDKYKVKVGKEKFTFRYAIPRDAKSARKAWGIVKSMIRTPGDSAETPAEIKIRAISTDEMDIISKFTPFKMVEPLFVVNDRFVLGYNKKGELEVLDEVPYYTPFFERFEKIMSGDD